MRLSPLLCDPWPTDIDQCLYAGRVYIEGCTAGLVGIILMPEDTAVWRIISEPYRQSARVIVPNKKREPFQVAQQDLWVSQRVHLRMSEVHHP